MKKRLSQKDMIMKHLEDFGSITSWTAFTDYGITRLSAVIFNLRDDGCTIESEIMTAKNRYGNTTHFSKYILAK